MSFLADVITEDSFYENLTLGLTKLLDHTHGVEDVKLERRLPCERMQLSSWEQRHCCIMPTDMRHFYLSTDGFKLTWNYRYASELLPLGNLNINSIGELKRIGGVKGQEDCGAQAGPVDITKPHFGVKCKMFELDACRGNGRVCLVYLDRQDTDDKAKIWLMDRSLEWHLLANSFSQYFRMMLVHQGLPQWQFRFTPMGLTPFAEQVMSLIAPHLLLADGGNDAEVIPQNHLDPNVFKNPRSKTNKKKEIKQIK